MTNETNAGTRRSKTDKMKDKVEDAKETVQETASNLATEAREKGSHIAEEGREKAHEIGDKAQHMARSRAEEQKQRVTNGMRTFADALRRGCDDLSTDQNQYRPLLNSAADRVEGVSRYLEQHDVDDLTNDVRRFARDHTSLFIGGAFALGFAGARFLKSSPERVYDYDDGYSSTGSQGRYDRMLPETGSIDRTGTSDSFQARGDTASSHTGFESRSGTQRPTGSEGTAGMRGASGTSGSAAPAARRAPRASKGALARARVAAQERRMTATVLAGGTDD